MGNNSPSLDKYNNTKKITLEKFQEQTKRKMTIHILSNTFDDCIKFIELFTNEKVEENSEELLEKNIKKKLNLYSFMNYKIYKNAINLTDKIEKKIDNVVKQPKEAIYSEVIIILDNKDIETQINEIRKKFKKNEVMCTNQYFIPFLIIISPQQINLKGFFKSKTFHYKITFDDIFNYYLKIKEKKEKERNNEKIEEINELKIEEKNEEFSAFLRKLNVLFSYYNELGDDFSFINSEEKEQIIKIEDDTNITVFVNILFLGRTGSGKSTLINLLLGEKKSIEGGTGFSTTSKNIIVYKKTGVPIRLYDVKGIENEKTVNNYVKILTDFNINKSNSNDAINAIFYCIEYKNGTIIEEMEFKLFEKLITFNIQIIFMITKTPYDINEKNINKKAKASRKMERDTIKNAIKNLIKSAFKDIEKEGEEFIKNYIKFYFVNLIPNYSLNVPAFGIDKILSFFSESVSTEDWDDLEKYCF